jgi:hypothetical protein
VKGGENLQLLLILTSIGDRVSGQRHTPAALNSRYPLERRLGGPQLVWAQRLEKKFFSSAEDRTAFAQSFNLQSDTILTELHQLSDVVPYGNNTEYINERRLRRIADFSAIQKNREALLGDGKEVGLEVNSERLSIC